MFLSIKIKKFRIFYLQIFIFFFFFCGKLFRNLIGIFSKCIDVFCLVKICVFTLRVFIIREIFRSLTYLKYIFKMFVTFNNVLTASILLCMFNSHKLPHFPYYIVKMCYLHDYRCEGIKNLETKNTSYTENGSLGFVEALHKEKWNLQHCLRPLVTVSCFFTNTKVMGTH